jgi:Fuc2NAc and GlcNAc transferase
MLEYVLAAVVLTASIVLTAIFRSYALKRSLLDLPTARSSHVVPTPRGGGLSIVLTFLCAILVLFAYGRMSLDDFMVLFVGGSLVAGIGFLDDHGHIPARWRILVHFAAAAWVVWWLGGVTSIALDDRNLESGFLGFVLGVFALLTSVSGALPLWSWLILLGVFVVDATTTLMRRMMRGERWYEAHRSHAYQHAAQHYKSHLKVIAVVCVINVVWLLPLAWYASIRPEMGLVLVCVAFGPLVLLALKFGAGKPVCNNYS